MLSTINEFVSKYGLEKFVVVADSGLMNNAKIEIRPMFHFTRKRIEAHICICFVALQVYKELERLLKVSAIKMTVTTVLA